MGGKDSEGRREKEKNLRELREGEMREGKIRRVMSDGGMRGMKKERGRERNEELSENEKETRMLDLSGRLIRLL